MTEREAAAHLQVVRASYENHYHPSVISTYQYWAQVDRIVDGDTLDLSMSLGFNLTVAERVRLVAVDTPEVFGVPAVSASYRAGQEAVQFVRDFCPESSWVEARIYVGRREKYGRWLGEIFVDGASLNVQLLAHGFATAI